MSGLFKITEFFSLKTDVATTIRILENETEIIEFTRLNMKRCMVSTTP